MDKKTQEKLNRELGNTRLADKELDNAVYTGFLNDVMTRIEQRREELNKKSNIYTQAYLAKKIGLSRATYTNYMNGSSNSMTVVTLKKIADVLSCNVTDFIN